MCFYRKDWKEGKVLKVIFITLCYLERRQYFEVSIRLEKPCVCGWCDDDMRRRQLENIKNSPMCTLINGRGEYYQPKTVRTILKQF